VRYRGAPPFRRATNGAPRPATHVLHGTTKLEVENQIQDEIERKIESLENVGDIHGNDQATVEIGSPPRASAAPTDRVFVKHVILDKNEDLARGYQQNVHEDDDDEYGRDTVVLTHVRGLHPEPGAHVVGLAKGANQAGVAEGEHRHR